MLPDPRTGVGGHQQDFLKIGIISLEAHATPNEEQTVLPRGARVSAAALHLSTAGIGSLRMMSRVLVPHSDLLGHAGRREAAARVSL